ncbi:MAG: bifunctional 2-C-methyl-D-erythritol 4-phosphate cytidylyltransferase/2-C-methyl-D-erythritol 2,4-cyclodiphosphate synthase [Neomegalonema sp.]|nr:bifunctional 2-C-methyl-D-erythritol 4-phosphate cytidylyltransferase/2-C-methyl-D-erythritol 2,4-cyclodiphosphate synthase [Neomegalonema sp.]
MKLAALIVAAGRGSRAGIGLPKQYRRLGAQTVLTRTLRVFLEPPEIDACLVAIHPDDRALYDQSIESLSTRLTQSGAKPRLLAPVHGGESRQQTVLRALETLASGAYTHVLIHDAARPFLPSQVLSLCIQTVREGKSCYPALAVVDTLRRHSPDETGTIDRTDLFHAQTPQCFVLPEILDAHRRFAEHSATDDVELAQMAGIDILPLPGARENIKLTTQADFDWAQATLIQDTPPMIDLRTGQGFDVHKFGPNADGSTDHVMLCGIRVPHDTGLVGHSDADVGLHALSDALYGALGEGDIGRHFPPSDPQWRGASSDIFLAHAADLVRKRGGRIANLDLTLICERPKITPHAAAMQERCAQITGLEPARISIKATTSEGLGFTGRREGIAALALATVLL